MVEEAVVDFLEQIVPVIGLILTEEPHGGVPRGVGAVQAPAPVRGVGQQQPGGLAEGAGEVSGGGVHGNHEIGLVDKAGGISEVADFIPQITHVLSLIHI